MIIEKKNEINILHLRSSGGFFGAEGVILNLARELNNLGFNNYIVCVNNLKNPHAELVDEANKIGLKAESVLCRRIIDSKTVFEIRSLLKKYKINILHCHDYKANFFGFFAAKIAGVKRVAMVHGWTGHTLKVRIYELLDKFILRFFDKIIVVAESLKGKLIRAGISESKVEIIHNAIDLDKYPQTLNPEKIRNEFGIKEKEKIIGTVGRLSKEKGHRYFLEAAAQILKAYSNVRFILVGDGPESENLKTMSRELGIQDKVIFAGYRRNIELFFSAFDIFVLPSLTEGLPNVILESFAFRKPVVATDVGGTGELVRHKKTGFLVKPEDSKELAQGITSFLENPDQTRKMTYEGYKLVKENFSVKERVKKIEEIYLDLVNREKAIIITKKIVEIEERKILMLDVDHSKSYKGFGFDKLIHRRRLKIILSEYESIVTNRTKRCVDVGCSNGFMFATLRMANIVPKEVTLYGFDWSIELLEMAKKRKIDNSQFVYFDISGENSEYYNQFDIVSCFETLEHVGNYKKAFDNLYNLTKINGDILVTVPIEIGQVGIFKFFARKLRNKNIGRDFFSRQSQVDYVKTLFFSKDIERFRSSNISDWGTHLGFNYKNLLLYIQQSYLSGRLECIKNHKAAFGCNQIMHYKKKI